jgi:hypothetical protein
VAAWIASLTSPLSSTASPSVAPPIYVYVDLDVLDWLLRDC